MVALPKAGVGQEAGVGQGLPKNIQLISIKQTLILYFEKKSQ